jgi:hypothetical protein
MSAAATSTAGAEASRCPDSLAAREPASQPQASRQSQWLFHSLWLVLPALAIGLSLVLEIRDQRQVLLPLVKMPLPELCSFRRMTGLDCAGCGLTRCFISIGHGRLADAWRYHPAGFLLYALAAFQLPWRSLQLWRLWRGAGELQLGKFATGAFYGLAIILLGIWIVRIWSRIVGWEIPL